MTMPATPAAAAPPPSPAGAQTPPGWRRKIGAGPPRGGVSAGQFVDLGPDAKTAAEWALRGLTPPDLAALRAYRLARVREQLAARDCGAILLCDPLNIRYACDASNMQVRCAHNAVRYLFLPLDGPLVLFEFHSSRHLAAGLDLIAEVRPAISWNYMHGGEALATKARRWAAEIVDLMVAHGGNRRLAVDRVNPEGAAALGELGLSLHNGEAVMELARVVKGAPEIAAMRCALAACETAMAEMQAALAPGVTEIELWSHLHAGNIKRGGEWIETRLLTSGARTNPWLRECGSRQIQAGDLVAFDTDLIGPYGYCADISRTWLCGDRPASGTQRDLFAVARQHIDENRALLKPGVHLRELTEKSDRLPEAYRAHRYPVVMHGVGLCDEYPIVVYPEDAEHAVYDAVMAPGMVLCVEAYVGAEGGGEGVKLEEQVLITDTGSETLSHYPFDPALDR